MQDRSEAVNSLINQLKLACPSSATPILVKLEAEFERQTTEIETLAMARADKGVYSKWVAMGLTKTEETLASAIEAAGDRGISYDAAMNMLCLGKAENELPNEEIHKVYICKIRKKLSKANYPFEFLTIWGRGYRVAKRDANIARVGTRKFAISA